MWFLSFLFLIATGFLGWTLFGYFILIWIMGLFRNRPTLKTPVVFPKLSIIIPCFNEEAGILAKLENLRSLDYPKDAIEAVFADGGSTDATVALLERALDPHEPFRLIRCARGGKINQINEVLPQLTGEIIINTDVDAILDEDALRWIAIEFNASPRIGVVGAYCRPGEGLDIEDYYWASQNKARFLENDAETASIVLASCYAFRRDLLSAFPENVVADDVYIAFLSNTMGMTVVFSRQARAVETRSPKNISEFLPHKFRKGNAFLRESLRFLYRLPEMPFFVKMIFLTRISQQLLLPMTIFFWFLIAASTTTLFHFDIVFTAIAFLCTLFVATSRVFAQVALPEPPKHYPLPTIIRGYILTFFILLANGFSYPFYHQGSNYDRIS
ncbi:MAG: glycosyltransferase [Candidatus Ozemobacteraceae bacterium]